MNKTTFLKFLILVFLSAAMVETAFVTSVAAVPSVHNTDTGLSYNTIQEAIDANKTLDGHTILVDAGIYHERLVVNKSLKISGEDSRTTIIDGDGMGGSGPVALVNASDVEIRGFTVQNGGRIMESGIIVNKRASRSTISDCVIRNNTYGITLNESNGSIITGNVVIDNSETGFKIRNSSFNVIRKNTLANNPTGVYITSSFSINNTFYHNNFFDNQNQVQSFGFNTAWDNGAEGNYWSGYMGLDDGSNGRTVGDGVGDTLLPHPGVGGGLDYNPLIVPTKPFPVMVDDVIYPVVLLSNSTVSSFYFDQQLRRIGFSVNGPLNTTGFSEIHVPRALMNETYEVFVNGTQVPHALLYSNSTYSGLYFTYNNAAQTVEIIPEFPAATFLSLFIFVTLATAVLSKRK